MSVSSTFQTGYMFGKGIYFAGKDVSDLESKIVTCLAMFRLYVGKRFAHVYVKIIDLFPFISRHGI